MNKFKKAVAENIDLKKRLIKILPNINISVKKIFECLKSGGKLMLCGNGGSAADAQHLAAEFLVRLRPKINRQPLTAISLATDISTITACGNDYNFENIYERTFQALHKKNDILIVISTSGMSKNLIKVAELAKKKKIFIISFLGSGGGDLMKCCNLNLIVPSSVVARIQEAHIFIGHYIFEQVENLILQSKKFKN